MQVGQPYTVDPYTCYIYVTIHNVGDKPTVILYTTFIAIVVSHIQRIGRQPETLLYTVANPAPRAWSAEQGNVYSSVYAIPVAYSFLHVPGMYVCVCVCVFFPSILDINGRISRGHTGGRSHRMFNPPSFCGACLDFCREKDSAIPFPRRP